ncbi:hypothetical protein LMG28688_03801 [Paraburkholderia caffeinitolerans]|uniref:DUF1254 domain-containing protein n=1 Tax=Paraburkholderia caffeinitolerans TaxID=1723730 RepID=A0A6J5G4Y4_9BURK|nr:MULTISPECIES: DUF1214 domain-containing protein [Paraburkholderia]CAB3793739.1 hypothetical protein LMG28688_03801 [Paraburkholderia caffeinitolerans]
MYSMSGPRRWRLSSLLGVAAALCFQTVVAQEAAAPGSTAAAVPASTHTLRSAAFDAAVWGMPIVSFDAMREAFFRDAGARYDDIVYWSRPADWKNQTTTPNSSALYVYFNYNLKDGPVVVDIPAENDVVVFGSLLDAWQVPLADVGHEGSDEGKGGRYLLLPPGFKGKAPAGFIPVQSKTDNGYALIRVTPRTLSRDDLDKAGAWIRTLHVAPLREASNGARQRFVKMDGKLFDGIVRFDDSYFARLARMVSEEPPAPGDADAYARLRALGIEQGRPFTPDASTRALLRTAAQDAHATFQQTLLSGQQPWWPGSQWGTSASVRMGVKTHFTFDEGQHLDADMRGAVYFLGYAPPLKLGKATFYLTSWRDDHGQLFDGSRHYRLHVPPNVPAREFWAVNVYDNETCGFIRKAPRIGADSYDTALRRNADGSVDLDFGPQPPSDNTANWIYTAPGKAWFVAFRFYGPEPAVFDKSWTLPDVVALPVRGGG